MESQNKINKYHFKSGLPQEFEILDIGEVFQRSKKALTSNHRTDFYQIIWFKTGNPIHLVDFNPIQIQTNSLLFLNKDMVQRFDENVMMDGKIILFTDSFFCRTESDTQFLKNTLLFNDLFSIESLPIQEFTSTFETILKQMSSELLNEKDDNQSEILQNLLHNFLLVADRVRKKQNGTELKKSPELAHVMLFKEHLEAHYKTKKQVSYYVNELCITEKKLNQATSRILGKQPKKIIDERVMLEAKRILAHTSKSIKEIGYELGFEEPTNFVKYFKKHANSTPNEFREKNTLA